jgi:predicted metalloprotease
MRWKRGRRSDNIEDRRGVKMSRGVAGGGIGALLLVLVALYFGVDPSVVVNTGILPSGNTTPYAESRAGSPEEDRLAEFVSVVLADTEDTWHTLLRKTPNRNPASMKRHSLNRQGLPP